MIVGLVAFAGVFTTAHIEVTTSTLAAFVLNVLTI